MSQETSLLISAKDNYSQILAKMNASTTVFRKSNEALQKDLDLLNSTKATLKVDMFGAKTELKEAQKAFANVGDEASRLNLISAQANYDNIKDNLSAVSSTARQTQKDMTNLSRTQSQLENRASNLTRNTGNSTISFLQTAGFTKMIGDAMTGVASAAVGSAFGSTGSTVFSNLLGSVSTGAALGGTAGAVAGLGVGAVKATTQLFSEQDDALKSTVQDNVNTVTQAQDDMLASGSLLAASREKNFVAFNTLLKGDTESAEDFNNALINIGRTPPFSYDLAVNLSKGLLGLGDTADETIKKINGLADAAAALGWSDSDVQNAMTIFNRILMTGTITSRDLRTLGGSLNINAYDIIGKKYGIDATNDKALEKLNVSDVVNAIYDYMNNTFKGAADSMSKTFEGMKGVVESYEDDMAAAMGKGYNKEKKIGFQEDINWYTGENGKKEEDANYDVGIWKASLENKKQSLMHQNEASMFSSNEYKKAFNEGDALTIGKLMQEAKIKGMNEYKATDDYQLQLQASLSLIDDTTAMTAAKSDYWNAGYLMRKEYSKGFLSVAFTDDIKNAADSILGMNYPEEEKARTERANSHATGISYVPYNNYPAILHEGERVLTAGENRQYNGKAGVTVTGNTFIVRKENDIDEIADKIANKLYRASVLRGAGNG
ncbi:MAG: tape measure protein [Clostridia bacterium]|jgi:tape measure domain-containing protein|nr:tape measure protein [Clostridia bacterium]